MSEYTPLGSDYEQSKAFRNGMIITGTFVTLTAVGGYAWVNNHSSEGSAHADSPDAQPKHDPKDFRMRVGSQVLRCKIAADKYIVQSGDNLWNIVRSETDDYQDVSHINPKFIHEWHGTIKLGQRSGDIGADPNLIYPKDEISVLKHCDLEAQPSK